MRDLAVYAEYDARSDLPPSRPKASLGMRIVRAAGAFVRKLLRSARWNK
jgi:hypothetical protein